MTKLTKGLTSKSEYTKLEITGVYCFWAAFLFELVYLVFWKSDFYLPEENKWIIGVSCLYIVKILCTKYTKKEWCMIALLALISLLAYCTVRNIDYFRILVFVVASKEINRKTTFEMTGISLVCMTLLLAVRCLLGIQGTLVDVGEFGRGVTEMRYRFGFSHANQLHYTVFCVIAVYLWVKKDTLTWKEYFLLLVSNTALLYLTRSRTGALTIYLMIIGSAAMHYCRKLRESNWVYNLGFIALAGVTGATCIGRFVDTDHVLYPYLWKIDMALTGRWNLAYRTSPRPLQLFSNRNGGETDMGLIVQANANGVVMTILFLIAMMGLVCAIKRKKDGASLVLLLATLLYILTENQQALLGWASQSFVILLLIDQWYCLFQKEKGMSSYLWKIGK